MKNNIENALIEMGMSPALSGFKYIVAAVIKLDTPEWENGKIIALYAEIAKEYCSSGSKVERAIRHAFEVVRAKGNPDFVQKYIGYENTANSDSLKMMHWVLKKESENSNMDQISSVDSEENSYILTRFDQMLKNINVVITNYLSEIAK